MTPSLAVALLSALLLFGGACGGGAPARDCRLRVDASAGALTLGPNCFGATLALVPGAQIDGAWLAGTSCRTSAGAAPVLTCAIGSAGEIDATLDVDTVSLRVRAARAASLGGLQLAGRAAIPGAYSWLSNGFQSWSQSGMVALGAPPADAELASALTARGDLEVVRSGNELSWWYTLVGGAGPALFAGALSAERFRSWASVVDGDDGLRVRLVSGGAGESVAIAASETALGERWRIEMGDDPGAAMERYGRALPSRRKTVRAPAEAGWNSWYELWDSVDEAAIRENAPLALAKVMPFLPAGTRPRLVVDDGWEEAFGVWAPNAKFPSGLEGLARDLRAMGFEMGVWLAPLLVKADTDFARAHPDWFVAGADFPHLKNGVMKVLDVTHPEAAMHLEGTIRKLVGWGYSLLKIDFLFVGAYEGPRREPLTGMQAYQRAMQIIRRGAGEGAILLAVGAPPLPSFPFVDGWRVGGDIAVEPIGPSWYFVVNEARSLSVRWPLCFATLCDPDPPLQRALGRDDVELGGWAVALAGGGLFFSDDLRALPSERAGWGVDAGRARLALGGVPSRPVDLFGAAPAPTLASALADSILMRSNQVVPARWATPDSARVILNFSDAPLSSDGATIPPHRSLHMPAQ